jgi:hypothetical protein
MNTKLIASMLCVGTLLLGSWSDAVADDEHHLGRTDPQQLAPPAASPRQSGSTTDMGMPGMMPRSGHSPRAQERIGTMLGQGQMPMSAMMDQRHSMMGMSNLGEFAETFPGTGMMQRVEGRIAFLRAELEIDESQQAAWTAFAQALRDNAKALGDTHAKAMKRQISNEVPTLAKRLAAQEEWFAARTAGIGELRRALDGLYTVLSDEQKESADELLAPHVGMGAGGVPVMSMGGMRMPMQSHGGIH